MGTFSPGVFWPGGGIFVWEGFCPEDLCPSPQVQCVYEPSRLSVPSMIYVYPAGGRIQLTYQERDGQKKDKLGPVAPRGLDPRSPNFQGM